MRFSAPPLESIWEGQKRGRGSEKGPGTLLSYWNGVGPGEKLLVRNTASCMAIRVGRRMTASIGS